MGAGASIEVCSVENITENVVKLDPAYEIYRQNIIDSGITGKMLLEAKSSSELDSIVDSIVVADEKHKKDIKKYLRNCALPPIRLLNFEDFKKHGEFPRYPDQKHLVTSLDNVNRDECFIVFISHCWLRGYPGAEGYENRPHPDNKTGDKFKLCVKGVHEIWQSMAKSMKKCYLWLDFCCIDQTPGSACGELKMLKDIIECCDCIFTPIYDADPTSWTQIPSPEGEYENYKAKLWNDGPHAYLNRGWCRVEMFYAANIPILPSGDGIDRHSKFAAGLAVHVEANRRPHILYGSREGYHKYSPIILPPLQNSWLDKYHPTKGFLSVASDMKNIEMLTAELAPYLKRVQEGYVGERNEKGEMHGFGTYTCDNGDVYEGEWKNDMMHGQGVYKFCNGDAYNGDWKDDKTHGHGVFKYADGSVHEGEYKDGRMNGHGVFKLCNGDVYKGEYKDGLKHGYGVYTFANGFSDRGNWKNGEFQLNMLDCLIFCFTCQFLRE